MSASFDYRQVLSPSFVETGSYRGDGIAQALGAGFETVHSIEIADHWINHCRQRFAREIADGRLVLWQGDTLDVLPRVIAHLSRPATFWLDAHSHPHNTGTEKSAVNCPLYHELGAIAASPIRSHRVLIDDLRLITDPRSWGGHDVTFSGMLERLRAINSNYAFAFLDGLIEKDVLVARVETGMRTDQATLDAFLSDPLSQSIRSARSALACEVDPMSRTVFPRI
ncbi:hypothetical protein Thiowin_04222 [Thiorhodovibrio winogradskyi]|uniref:Class I SAM-dependent methyltransferase n=1 Tax=Thiorhodovibrio winogradskyi TaxID=77007 RepID=A0ABZ0SDK5_9GAMM|nr:hypothetical protein [Thiorhodovibrio winogradskyi]